MGRSGIVTTCLAILNAGAAKPSLAYRTVVAFAHPAAKYKARPRMSASAAQQQRQQDGAISTGDRVAGVLLGLSCGDAVGCTSEFQIRGTFPPVMDMVGGGAHRLEKGQWTDDTSLALCLAQSLIESSGHDPRDQLTRYLSWFEEGRMSSTGECFDIGHATESSLEKFRYASLRGCARVC